MEKKHESRWAIWKASAGGGGAGTNSQPLPKLAYPPPKAASSSTTTSSADDKPTSAAPAPAPATAGAALPPTASAPGASAVVQQPAPPQPQAAPEEQTDAPSEGKGGGLLSWLWPLLGYRRGSKAHAGASTDLPKPVSVSVVDQGAGQGESAGTDGGAVAVPQGDPAKKPKSATAP